MSLLWVSSVRTPVPDGLICGMGHWPVDTDDIWRSRDGHRDRHQTVASRPSSGSVIIMDLRVKRDVLLTWSQDLTHQDYLHRQLSSMQRAGQFCDLRLVCGTSVGQRTLSCHKIVLTTHSTFFRFTPVKFVCFITFISQEYSDVKDRGRKHYSVTRFQ